MHLQWILASDGACGRCRAIAERVVALGGGRLAARSLRDPAVAAWRERALGPEAPWEPVLLAVAGDRLQAYTGRRLVLQLVRLLGVRRGLALASELRALAPPAGAGPALTRRRVLGRLAGLGTALGLLASGKLAVPGGAHARGQDGGRPWWAVEPIKTSVLDPAAREKLLAEFVAGPDLPAVLGAAELAAVQAAEHRLADGRTLWAAALALPDDQVLAYYVDDAGQKIVLHYRIVTHGVRPQLAPVTPTGGVQRASTLPERELLAQRTCSPPLIPCSCCCGNLDLFELLTCCGLGCYGICRSRWWIACAACILVLCPACLWRACRAGWPCTCCCAEPGT
ncbi:Tat (twin-arginine translocation) pathway signal sequence domain-containing protein [Thermomicrobium sp. 4228-Ro]|uniref:Tat (twin-arginine translocation) pathway signal sequence domain-containing protein n=1 Tax=Thermomicrobium sp. 4228-Ro TaxID=2993937 RepID=UPI0022493816|nr:Tat (twin-arginine translocation) pathway signal sequence domain-containing protein [Thermomicrobium sp. 4228-Ro]MCX2728099.1 Tat (twin-arginine translocation) pathway signal sequence domain-containing protein [Thermomicrobium sp. 4228-Ro]